MEFCYSVLDLQGQKDATLPLILLEIQCTLTINLDRCLLKSHQTVFKFPFMISALSLSYILVSEMISIAFTMLSFVSKY